MNSCTAIQTCFLLAYLLLGIPAHSFGQFVDLTLNVEPELSAQTERSIDFGELETNAGEKAIFLGDLEMGLFSIQALEHQELYISLDIPTELEHVDEEITETIPLDLQARWGYNADNPQNSMPVSGDMMNVIVRPNAQPGPVSRLYLFIFGSLLIGDIPEGYYENRIVLDVEYL